MQQLRQTEKPIRNGDVAEVCSHDHVLLQCTDIVLGAMYFRLNNLHLEKPAGSRTRGKRTIAKEKLYKHINSQISSILPHFNIGVNFATTSPTARGKKSTFTGNEAHAHGHEVH